MGHHLPLRALLLAAVLAAPAAPDPAAAAVVFTDPLGGADRLVTNEWAHWNPGGVESPDWQMTSGTLFVAGGTGWTGVPDDCAPDRMSSACTNSAVFRLNMRRFDFGDVRVETRLRANAWVSTPSTPPAAWDGVHLWLRYRSEESLYYASVARRDGAVAVKKKCPGGSSNGGTYVTLATRSGQAIDRGAWQLVGASIETLADGEVAIEVQRAGVTLLRTVDGGTGCPPIRDPGAIGVRGDNLDFSLRDLTVSGACDCAGEPDDAPAPAPAPGPADPAPGPGAPAPSPTPVPASPPAAVELRAPRIWRHGSPLTLRVRVGGRPRSVALLLDGRRVAVDRRAPFSFRYKPPRRLRTGVHRLQAVTSSGGRSRPLRLRYGRRDRCHSAELTRHCRVNPATLRG